jgi:prepilin-type N-terminal cleavage/methylation domain-containing protein
MFRGDTVVRKIKSLEGRGFTLVEVIVGIALMAIVFSGIFGAYRLSLKVVNLSKNKITATAIANEQIEIIRNLPYSSVGTAGAVLPLASGTLVPTFAKSLDGINFTVSIKVQFIIDPADGTGSGDTCNWDYKNASVIVSWKDVFPGSVMMSTIVAPGNIVEENQTCLSQPGGVLTVTVFDSHGVLLSSPLISIYDTGGTILYDSATPTTGVFSFALAAGTYRVVVTKNGYSMSRSYGSNEIATPNTLNPTVLIGGNVPVSLSIDKASTVTVNTISPTGVDNFSDSFTDQTKISVLSGTQVASGSITLVGPPFGSGGFAISSPIAPSDLVSWNSFDFLSNLQSQTNILYQILYFDGANWVLVPNRDLGGNSAGFSVSPIDLSGLSTATYPQLEIKANLSSSDPAVTPGVANWQIVWTSNVGAPIPWAGFHMQGNKTLGKDSGGNYVYKYVTDNMADGAGQVILSNVEGDTYTFSPTATSTLSLIGTDPSPQPISVPVNSAVAAKLYMRASNALLATVQDDQSLLPVFSASVELKNGAGYDKTQYINQKGQTYFAPISSGNYTILVQTSGYNSYSGSVSVLGQGVKLINLHQIQ